MYSYHLRIGEMSFARISTLILQLPLFSNFQLQRLRNEFHDPAAELTRKLS